MNCEHPTRIVAIMRAEKIARINREADAVRDFLEEDEDIQDYNFRHFGQRTS